LIVHLKNALLDNKYFFIPFLFWCIAGAILLLSFEQHQLFFSINQWHSRFGDYLNTSFSSYGRGDTIPIILISLLFIPAFRNRNYIVTTLLFGIFIPVVIYYSKFYFDTPRPLKVYGNNKVHTVSWLDNLYQLSFPSGHTIGAFGLFAILSFYLPKQYKRWSILLFTLALATAYSRLYLGQHFFADVYAGSIIGTVLTYLIYAFGKKYIS
jgi:membrane-associated phospholipid phosphatase